MMNDHDIHQPMRSHHRIVDRGANRYHQRFAMPLGHKAALTLKLGPSIAHCLVYLDLFLLFFGHPAGALSSVLAYSLGDGREENANREVKSRASLVVFVRAAGV